MPRSLPAALALIALLLLGAPAAQAAWPGTPGKIAYLNKDSSEMPLMVWTPDGKGSGTEQAIGIDTFHWQSGSDKVPMTNGFPSAPVWSPDGTRVAFAAKVGDPSLGPGATHTAIFTWRVRDGAITQLTTPPAGDPGCDNCELQLGYVYADYSPAWSPDGKTIAFIRLQVSGEDESVHGTDGGNIRTVPATGGGSTALTHSYGEQQYLSLSWGGDPTEGGSRLLMGLHASAEGGGFTMRRIDPGSGTATTELGGVDAAGIEDFDVATDGRSFDYVRYDGHMIERRVGTGAATDLGAATVRWIRASPTGNGPLHPGMTTIPGQGSMPRAGLIERQAPDPEGDVWDEDPEDRWVNGWVHHAANGPYAFTTIGRSTFDVQPQQLPIINIPGFGGSEIRCGDEHLWGPTAFGMGGKLDALQLGPDGKTNVGCAGAGPTANPDDPTGFVLNAIKTDIYKQQADFITTIVPGQRGWRFSWDWRMAPAESIERLDTFVDKIMDSDFAKDQGLTRVVMYAHSYGGLLIREYLDGHAERVARVLTAGTPYWGSIKPLNFATFGLENPLSGPADLDTVMPNANAKAFARNLAGLYWFVPSDPFGQWLTVGGIPQDQAGVRKYFTDIAGGNGALVDAARAWHQTFDGFYTARGTVETRAVVGTGLPTIVGVDTGPAAHADGMLDVVLHLGQGDVTVPIRSASQGDLGTHTPLGDPVHAQAVCGIGHMALGGDPKVTVPYTDYLLRGRTPRKTEGACAMEATQVAIKLQTRPGVAAAPAAAVDGGGMSLDEAAAAGKIQLLRYPGQPIALADDRHPLTLDIAGADQQVVLEITRYRDGKRLPTVTYRPAAGAVQVATGEQGAVVTVDGETVQGEGGGGGTPPAGGDDEPTGGADQPTSGGGGTDAPATPAPAATPPPAPVTGAAAPATTPVPTKAITKPKPTAKRKVKAKTTKRCKTIKKKVHGRTRTVKRCTTVKPKAKHKPTKTKAKAKPTKTKAKHKR